LALGRLPGEPLDRVDAEESVQMPTLKETLKRLAATFTVRDIMVPRVRLICSDGEEHAAKVSDDNPEFNVIPIPQEGQLTSYFERDSRNTKKIELNDLISDGTSLLDLVEILESRVLLRFEPPTHRRLRPLFGLEPSFGEAGVLRDIGGS
jgi:hypothetical protein